jgi:hypothetical protein
MLMSGANFRVLLAAEFWVSADYSLTVRAGVKIVSHDSSAVENEEEKWADQETDDSQKNFEFL